MVLEATMIFIDNSEWPPHRFSNNGPYLGIISSDITRRNIATPAGQTKVPTVSSRVTPSRDQASAGLMLIPTKAWGLLLGTMIRGTITRGLNHY
jgi:hypothetical protein